MFVLCSAPMIECLPDELGDLIHLRWCRQLRKLPIEILHIQQLRHLLMSDRVFGGEIRVPKGIGTLVNLHTLSGIYGGDDIAMELIALTQLRELGVKRVSADHASELFAAIKKMENLTSLSLEAEENYFD
ncbi:hypothetical protein D5086_019302 [Populus alba]|uniref:Uncharacterized protein n=1 Tax=Populus alba TaxID=43335 RepID=A0ACC4BGT6_POPAL